MFIKCYNSLDYYFIYLMDMKNMVEIENKTIFSLGIIWIVWQILFEIWSIFTLNHF